MISHENHKENIHSIKKTWTTYVPWEKSVIFFALGPVSEALPGARLGDLLWWRTHHLCRCQLVVWWGSNRWKPEKRWLCLTQRPCQQNFGDLTDIILASELEFHHLTGFNEEKWRFNGDLSSSKQTYSSCGLLAYLVGWLALTRNGVLHSNFNYQRAYHSLA